MHSGYLPYIEYFKYYPPVWECNNVKKNIDLLIATDELCLDDLRSNVELNLLKNKELLKQNFVLIQRVTNQFT